MKLFLSLLLFLASGSLFAQTPSLTMSGPASARPGATVNMSINDSGTTQSGVQWSVTPPAGFTLPTAVVGSAASAATKTLYCNPTNTTCLVIGMNQTIMAAGEVAKYTFTVPPAQPAGSVSFALSNVVATDPNGNAVAITAGPNLSLLVLSKYDLNGDGVINNADFDIGVRQTTGVQACGLADVNGDTICDIKDLQLLVKAVLNIP